MSKAWIGESDFHERKTQIDSVGEYGVEINIWA
jgi:hypothetical protein